MLIRIITFISLAAGYAAAQAPDTVWTRAYGGYEADMGNAFIETSDGAFLIVGSTSSFGENGDIYLIKINSQGEWFFNYNYGGIGSENALSVVESYDGGYILSGYSRFYANNYNNLFLGKTDSDGNLIWSQVYVNSGSQDYGQSVLETSDQDIVVAGYTRHYNPTNKNVILMKTNARGDSIWYHEYGSDGEDVGQSVVQTNDNGYVIAGWTTSYGIGSGDIYLIKTDSDGNQLWYRTYGYQNWEEASCVIQTSDGGFAIIGRTDSGGNGWWDVYLVKTDSSGTMQWWQTYGGDDWDGGHSVEETDDGGFLLGCYTFSFGAGDCDYYLIRTDSLGNEVWHKTLGDSSSDWGYSAIYASDGNIYFMGDSWSYGHGSVDIYLVKLQGDMTDAYDYAITNPKSFQLLQNFPNPFNAATQIPFNLPGKSDVLIEIYNVLGQKVATLFEGRAEAGYRTITWDADSNPSGVYFYRIKAGDKTDTRQMVLLR